MTAYIGCCSEAGFASRGKAGHPWHLSGSTPIRIMKAVIASFGGNEAPLIAIILGLWGAACAND